MRKIPDDVRVAPGWALARFGDGGWWPAVQRGLRGGELDDEVVAALADVVRSRAGVGEWLTFVPSVSLGGALQRLGERVAAKRTEPDSASRSDSLPRADVPPAQGPAFRTGNACDPFVGINLQFADDHL
jgi:ATP-dependent DNA helicase RecQ